MSSNTILAYRRLARILFSHPAWILLGTLFILLFTQWETSLFGLIHNEPLQGFLAFSPFSPWREWGLSLFSYPLVHESLEHWFVNAFCWLIFASNVSKAAGVNSFPKELLALGFYACLSVVIALTYLLPFAPSSTEHDRILGLSATIFFQLGFLLSNSRNAFFWIFLLAIGITYGYFGAGSALAIWGHASGFLIGVTVGLLFRFRREN